MKSYFNAMHTFMAVILFVLWAVHSANGESLQWQFRDGETIEMNTVQTVEIEKPDRKTKRTIELFLTATILKVDEQGSAEIEFDVQRIRVTLELPNSPPQTYDSEENSEDRFSQTIGAAYKSLVGGKQILLVDKFGSEIKSTDAHDKQDAKSLLVPRIFQLPDKQLSDGLSWQRTDTIPIALTNQKIQREVGYRYDGIQKKNDKELDTITMTGTLKILEKPNGVQTIHLPNQSTNGSITFDRQEGRLVKSELRTGFTLQIATGDQKMETVVSLSTSVVVNVKQAEAITEVSSAESTNLADK